MRTVHVIGKDRFMKVIASKFGSLAMLLGIAGLDTGNKIVRKRVAEIETSRDPIKITIHYRSYAWVLWVGEHPNKQPAKLRCEKCRRQASDLFGGICSICVANVKGSD